MTDDRVEEWNELGDNMKKCVVTVMDRVCRDETVVRTIV